MEPRLISMPKFNVHFYTSPHPCEWLCVSTSQTPELLFCPALAWLLSALLSAVTSPRLLWCRRPHLTLGTFCLLSYYLGLRPGARGRNWKSGGMHRGKQISVFVARLFFFFFLNGVKLLIKVKPFYLTNKKMLRVCFYFPAHLLNNRSV